VWFRVISVGGRDRLRSEAALHPARLRRPAGCRRSELNWVSRSRQVENFGKGGLTVFPSLATGTPRARPELVAEIMPFSRQHYDFSYFQKTFLKTYHSHLVSHTSVRHFLHHHRHHPLLLLSSTQGSKLIFSTNPFLQCSDTFSPTELTPRTPAVFRFSRACRF